MKKCPYCGHENADSSVNCERCYAWIPVEEPKPELKQEKQPVKKAVKKTNKE